VAIREFKNYKSGYSVGITWLVELPSQYEVCVGTCPLVLPF